MGFFRRYSLVIGLLTLAYVVVILFSIPGVTFSSGVFFIDTELHKSSGSEAFVRTKLDFGDKEHMKAFPMKISNWEGYNYDISKYEEIMGADVILLRAYSHPKYDLPVLFFIMQSRTESSFHPPPVCYRAIGYEIEEEGNEKVFISDASWVQDQGSYFERTIPFKKMMVVFKRPNGEVSERRVVLYCYVKGNRFTSNTITMIQASAWAPFEGSYDGALNVVKGFTAQTIPYMFEPHEEEGQTFARRLAESGIGGYSVIAILLSIPLAIIILPRIKK